MLDGVRIMSVSESIDVSSEGEFALVDEGTTAPRLPFFTMLPIDELRHLLSLCSNRMLLLLAQVSKALHHEISVNAALAPYLNHWGGTSALVALRKHMQAATFDPVGINGFQLSRGNRCAARVSRWATCGSVEGGTAAWLRICNAALPARWLPRCHVFDAGGSRVARRGHGVGADDSRRGQHLHRSLDAPRRVVDPSIWLPMWARMHTAPGDTKSGMWCASLSPPTAPSASLSTGRITVSRSPHLRCRCGRLRACTCPTPSNSSARSSMFRNLRPQRRMGSVWAAKGVNISRKPRNWIKSCCGPTPQTTRQG